MYIYIIYVLLIYYYNFILKKPIHILIIINYYINYNTYNDTIRAVYKCNR